MPGLPKLPFLVMAGVLLLAASRAKEPAVEVAAGPDAADADGEGTEVVLEQVRVDPLELELAPDLLDLLDPAQGGSLMERVRSLRKRIAGDLGLVVPPVRTVDAAGLPASTYVVKLHGVEAARGEAPAGHAMVLGDDANGVPGRATVDPVFGMPAKWVQEELAELLASEGATVIDRASVIVTHLSEVVRSAAGDLLTRQDVQVLVDAVKQVSPVVAGEIGGDVLSLSEVQGVLRDLLEEGVPVRDLTRILEAVTARARTDKSPEGLVEAARGVLGPTISSGAAVGGRLACLTLEPLLEASLLEAVRRRRAAAAGWPWTRRAWSSWCRASVTRCARPRPQGDDLPSCARRSCAPPCAAWSRPAAPTSPCSPTRSSPATSTSNPWE